MRAAFPTAIAGDVDVVLGALPEATHAPTTETIGPIRVVGERLEIPHRV